SNLVPDDTNGQQDIFVKDLKTGETTRVSVDSTGAQANSLCTNPTISANGRYVAFVSEASNLVPDDTNGAADVFVRDRKTGTTARVSVDSTGAQANSSSFGPSISANGRTVAFESSASNLVPDDTNTVPDVFVKDLRTGATARISVASTGAQGISNSDSPSISANGRTVVFRSGASNLVPDDTNGVGDVFARRR
ncbi:MAG: calcium-binding protein, partial [Planctomycetes bacterium]|nr:calcium-binding protein [Planctomycetota bacterium]